MLFKEVIGQTEVKQRLIQSYREGRLSHAQLLFGPEGSGVFPLALAFAQYITCENPGNEDSCGECGSCVKNKKDGASGCTLFFSGCNRSQQPQAQEH